MLGSGIGEKGRQWLRERNSRRMAAWVIGAMAIVAATSAWGIVANAGPHPKAVADTSVKNNALNAILLKNPLLGRPISQLVAQRSLPKPAYAGDNGTVGLPAGAMLPTLPAGTVSRFVPGAVNGSFNLLQLSALALSVGCPADEAPIAAAIAAAESGGNPGAQGDISLMDGTWDWSQGLWQIRGLRSERGTGGLRDSLANADPVKNAQAMKIISSGCTDWTPWSTYLNGAYLAYLGMSKTAVLAAQQYRSRTGSYPPIGSGQAVGVPAYAPPAPASSSSAGARRSGSPRPSHHPSPGRTRGGHPSSHPGARTSAVPAPKPGTSSTPNAPRPPVPTSVRTRSVLPSLPVPTKPHVTLPVPSTSLPVKLPKPSVSAPLPTLSVPVP